MKVPIGITRGIQKIFTSLSPMLSVESVMIGSAAPKLKNKKKRNIKNPTPIDHKAV